jgi:hypothetical protein
MSLIVTDPAKILGTGAPAADNDAAAASTAPKGGGTDAMWEAMIHQESRGRQFGADGRPLTSSKGAIGRAQVMPGTGPEAAGLAGLPWDENKWRTDASYNTAIGRAYFDKQLQTFGDPLKAAAAYNAGPGAMRRAQQRAAQAGDPGSWLSFLPAETKDYVAKTSARSGLAMGGVAEVAAVAAPSRFFMDAVEPAPDRTMGGVLQGIGSQFVQGVKSTARNVMATGATVAGSLTDVELLAEAQRAAGEDDQAAKKALMAEIEVRKQANPDAGIWKAIGDVSGAAAANPEGTAQLIAEQAPNTVLSLGGGLAGGKLGAMGGAAVAGPVGAVVGGTLGFLAGMFLGNAALETGGKAIEKAGDSDGFTETDRQEALREGAVKAGVVTAVDALTFKIGSVLAGALGRPAIQAGARAEARVLAEAGVNVADGRAVVMALAKDPALRKSAYEAGQSAASAASTRLARTGAAAGALGVETGGEVTGEYLGEYVATGELDPYDAALEGIAAFTQSVPQAAMATRSSASNQLRVKGIVAAAAEPNSPLSRAAVAGGAPDQEGDPGAPVLGDDPLRERANEIERAAREEGTLETLRSIGQPGRTTAEFLDAMAVAKAENMPDDVRQQAIESLEQALQWARTGQMPGDAATGSPMGTALSTVAAASAPRCRASRAARVAASSKGTSPETTSTSPSKSAVGSIPSASASLSSRMPRRIDEPSERE